MIDEKQNLLYLKSFDQPILLEGKSYWDSHSKIWSIIRLPARIKELYPQLKKTKLKFELRCFKDKTQIMDHLNRSRSVPILLNLCLDKQN